MPNHFMNSRGSQKLDYFWVSPARGMGRVLMEEVESLLMLVPVERSAEFKMSDATFDKLFNLLGFHLREVHVLEFAEHVHIGLPINSNAFLDLKSLTALLLLSSRSKSYGWPSVSFNVRSKDSPPINPNLSAIPLTLGGE